MAAPLSADRLVAGLRAEGCEVREYRDWRHHNRNHVGPWSPIHGVMMHHTATEADSGTVELCYEGYSGLPGPLCHGVITKSGTVWMVGNGRANHAGLGDDDVLRAVITEDYGDYPPYDNEANTDGNTHFYGFECVNRGDGEDPWPIEQYRSMVRAAAAVLRAYGWTSKSVIGHKEWQPGKPDPRGIDMKVFRWDVAACLRTSAGSWTKSGSASAA